MWELGNETDDRKSRTDAFGRATAQRAGARVKELLDGGEVVVTADNVGGPQQTAGARSAWVHCRVRQGTPRPSRHGKRSETLARGRQLTPRRKSTSVRLGLVLRSSRAVGASLLHDEVAAPTGPENSPAARQVVRSRSVRQHEDSALGRSRRPSARPGSQWRNEMSTTPNLPARAVKKTLADRPGRARLIVEVEHRRGRSPSLPPTHSLRKFPDWPRTRPRSLS